MAEDLTDLRTQLESTRDALERQLNGINTALAAIGGESIPLAHRGRLSVGDDKLEAVRKFLRGKRRVRQADITRATGFNSGTVSTAMDYLKQAGEVEAGPKENRSRTWVVRELAT